MKRAKLEKNKQDERKPQEITEDDITRSENETTKNVAAVSTYSPCKFFLSYSYSCQSQLEMILEQQEHPINLFKFIINPNDFGQSVENMFYLSFLIRDGKCALETNKHGEPVICTFVDPSLVLHTCIVSRLCSRRYEPDICQQPSEEDYAQGLIKRQIVMEFDMATWQVSP